MSINGKIIANTELERVWKQAPVSQFKVQHWHHLDYRDIVKAATGTCDLEAEKQILYLQTMTQKCEPLKPRHSLVLRGHLVMRCDELIYHDAETTEKVSCKKSPRPQNWKKQHCQKQRSNPLLIRRHNTVVKAIYGQRTNSLFGSGWNSPYQTFRSCKSPWKDLIWTVLKILRALWQKCWKLFQIMTLSSVSRHDRQAGMPIWSRKVIALHTTSLTGS